MPTPICEQVIIDQIEKHAASEPNIEVGGVLVGDSDQDGTTVVAALPALKAVGLRANVTFTHEVWEEVLQIVDRDHKGSRIVGWYHSHPGFGIFLSEYDKFIHKNFFSNEGSVALVVDPHSKERGWFGWVKGEIKLLGKIEPEIKPAAPVATSAKPTSKGLSVVLVAVLAAAVGIGVGWSLRSPVAQKTRVASADPTPSFSDNGELEAALAEQLRLEGELEATKAGLFEFQQSGPFTWMYEVKPGDTLWRISEFIYGSGDHATDLAKLNEIADPTLLQPGQMLKVRMRNP